MTLKTSLFNKGIYKSTLKRCLETLEIVIQVVVRIIVNGEATSSDSNINCLFHLIIN